MDRDLVDSQNFGYQNLGKFWQPLIFFFSYKKEQLHW
jgi:hypothetical protein